MAGSREREEIVRRFHAARPGATSEALARGGTYERLAALAPAGGRVLDLGAGDGYLCSRLAARGARAVGVDFSSAELARFAARVGRPGPPWPVAARAQALPFADGAFDACVSHLALMLMEDAPAVIGELWRVLRPGGRFAALLGGGPTASGDDAFHRFLAIAGSRLVGHLPGDRRTRSEAGFHELLAGWSDRSFDRWEIDLTGSFDEVWRFLGASYQLPAAAAAAVRAELAGAVAPLTDSAGRVPCRLVAWLGLAHRGHMS